MQIALSVGFSASMRCRNARVTSSAVVSRLAIWRRNALAVYLVLSNSTNFMLTLDLP